MITNGVAENKQLVAESSAKNSSLLNTKKDADQDFSESKIRVLIVDDLRLVCEGLQAVFVEDQNIDIVGFALNGKDAVKQVSEVKPDVVVLDLLMPHMGGVEATKKITKQNPDVKILILSSLDDDSIVSEIIAAGASGYVFKSMVMSELALAIRSVYSGSYHFAAGLLDNLVNNTANNTAQNSNPNALNLTSDQAGTISPTLVSAKPQVIQVTEVTPAKQAKQANQVKAIQATQGSKTKKTKQPKPEKPLFLYGDWGLLILGIIVLSQIDGMGHDLGHVGLFLLMLALLARPLKVLWDAPLKWRRGIGVVAFAAALGHAIYATQNFLEGNLATIAAMTAQHQWGMWIGIISLLLMAPAAVTSFQVMQRKLGKAWRQIHLLSVPSMALAILHTILVGPDYLMADAQMGAIDCFRTFALAALGIAIWLLRRRIVWSKLKLNDLIKSLKKSIKKPTKA